MATLKVTVHEARDLPVMNRTTGLTDPYVVLKLDDVVYVTGIAPRTRHPVWNCDFRFTTPELLVLQEDPLEVRVYDQDIISRDDIVGTVLIDCNCFLTQDNPILSGWFPLYDTNEGIHGDIRLTIRVKFAAADNPLLPSVPGRYIQRLHMVTKPARGRAGGGGHATLNHHHSHHHHHGNSTSHKNHNNNNSNSNSDGTAITSTSGVSTSLQATMHTDNSNRAYPSEAHVGGSEVDTFSQTRATVSHSSAATGLDSMTRPGASTGEDGSVPDTNTPGVDGSADGSHTQKTATLSSQTHTTTAHHHHHRHSQPLPPYFIESSLEPIQPLHVQHPTLSGEEEGVYIFSAWRLDPLLFRVETMLSMVEELLVKADPEHSRLTNLRSVRTTNEARIVQMYKLSGKVRRQLTRKVVELNCNAVLGYVEEFDMEDNGIIVRAYGTPCVVSAIRYVDEQQVVNLPRTPPKAVMSSSLPATAANTSSANAAVAHTSATPERVKATMPKETRDACTTESSPQRTDEKGDEHRRPLHTREETSETDGASCSLGADAVAAHVVVCSSESPSAGHNTTCAETGQPMNMPDERVGDVGESLQCSPSAAAATESSVTATEEDRTPSSISSSSGSGSGSNSNNTAALLTRAAGTTALAVVRSCATSSATVTHARATHRMGGGAGRSEENSPSAATMDVVSSGAVPAGMMGGTARASIVILTTKDLPAGCVAHIGGYICARSVKIVSRVKSRQVMTQERDAWWVELREELRANARAFHCNTILGYEEEAVYHEDVALLSLYGTAVMLYAQVPAMRAGPDYLYRAARERVEGRHACALAHLYHPHTRNSNHGNNNNSAHALHASSSLYRHAASRRSRHNDGDAVMLRYGNYSNSDGSNHSHYAHATGLPLPPRRHSRPRHRPHRRRSVMKAYANTTAPHGGAHSTTVTTTTCNHGSSTVPDATETTHNSNSNHISNSNSNNNVGVTNSHVNHPSMNPRVRYSRARRCCRRRRHGRLVVGALDPDMHHSICRECRHRPVPEVLLASCTLPPDLRRVGPPRLVQVTVARVRTGVKKGVALATALSQAMPYIEYSLHKQLLFQLRLMRLNACFAMRVSMMVGADVIAGTLTGTGYCLAALPIPTTPRVVIVDPAIERREVVMRLKSVVERHRWQRRQHRHRGTNPMSGNNNHNHHYYHTHHHHHHTSLIGSFSSRTNSSTTSSSSSSTSSTSTSSTATSASTSSTSGSSSSRSLSSSSSYTRTASSASSSSRETLAAMPSEEGAALEKNHRVGGTNSSSHTDMNHSPIHPPDSALHQHDPHTHLRPRRCAEEMKKRRVVYTGSATASEDEDAAHSWCSSHDSDSTEAMYHHPPNAGLEARSRVSDLVVKIDDEEDADVMLGMNEMSRFEDGVLVTAPYIAETAHMYDWQERVVMHRGYTFTHGDDGVYNNYTNDSSDNYVPSYGVDDTLHGPNTMNATAAHPPLSSYHDVRTRAPPSPSPDFAHASGEVGGVTTTGATYRGAMRGGSSYYYSMPPPHSNGSTSTHYPLVRNSAMVTRWMNKCYAEAKRAFVQAIYRSAMRYFGTTTDRLRVTNFRTETRFFDTAAITMQIRLEGLLLLSTEVGRCRALQLQDCAFSRCLRNMVHLHAQSAVGRVNNTNSNSDGNNVAGGAAAAHAMTHHSSMHHYNSHTSGSLSANSAVGGVVAAHSGGSGGKNESSHLSADGDKESAAGAGAGAGHYMVQHNSSSSDRNRNDYYSYCRHHRWPATWERGVGASRSNSGDGGGHVWGGCGSDVSLACELNAGVPVAAVMAMNAASPTPSLPCWLHELLGSASHNAAVSFIHTGRSGGSPSGSPQPVHSRYISEVSYMNNHGTNNSSSSHSGTNVGGPTNSVSSRSKLGEAAEEGSVRGASQPTNTVHDSHTATLGDGVGSSSSSSSSSHATAPPSPLTAPQQQQQQSQQHHRTTPLGQSRVHYYDAHRTLFALCTAPFSLPYVVMNTEVPALHLWSGGGSAAHYSSSRMTGNYGGGGGGMVSCMRRGRDAVHYAGALGAYWGGASDPCNSSSSTQHYRSNDASHMYSYANTNSTGNNSSSSSGNGYGANSYLAMGGGGADVYALRSALANMHSGGHVYDDVHGHPSPSSSAMYTYLSTMARKWQTLVSTLKTNMYETWLRARGRHGTQMDRLQRRRLWHQRRLQEHVLGNKHNNGCVDGATSIKTTTTTTNVNTANVTAARCTMVDGLAMRESDVANPSALITRQRGHLHEPVWRLPENLDTLTALTPTIRVTPLDYVPGQATVRYLGRLSQHFVREASDVYGSDALGAYYQRTEMEIQCCVQALVHLMGGNALLKHRVVYHEMSGADGSGRAFLFLTITGDVVQTTTVRLNVPPRFSTAERSTSSWCGAA